VQLVSLHGTHCRMTMCSGTQAQCPQMLLTPKANKDRIHVLALLDCRNAGSPCQMSQLTKYIYIYTVHIQVNVLYNDCTCPPRICRYPELLLERYNDISSTYVVTKKDGCNSSDIRSNEFKVASMSLS